MNDTTTTTGNGPARGFVKQALERLEYACASVSEAFESAKEAVNPKSVIDADYPLHCAEGEIERTIQRLIETSRHIATARAFIKVENNL